MDYLFVLVGLTGLFLGGEALVRGSVGLARRMSISPLVIGLTVVGFGTSTPELLVSLQAALRGVADIAVGNIVGSNIANVLLVVGLSALIWPIAVTARASGRDALVMIASAVLLVPLFAMEKVGRLSGLILVAGLGVYLVWTIRRSQDVAEDEDLSAGPSSPLVMMLWIGFGLVGLLVGARFLVDGAVSLAREFGVSEAFIGLTIVAVGTSLPELATSLIAAVRRQSDIAIGNIIGSNIFNVLGILGLTAVITPVPVAPRFLAFDLPVMIAASLVLAGFLRYRAVIGRGGGAAMVLAYAVYVVSAQ